MRSIYLLCLVFVCVTARIPFVKYTTQSDDKDPYDTYHEGTIANGVFYPFQRTVVINETQYTLTSIVRYNETYLHVNAQFLEISNEGSMLPEFNIPLNGTVMTVRLHTKPCYPQQGGYYYRNNATAEYGEHDNEIVGTRATDENGYLSMDVYRPWSVRTSDEQSIVITSASDGIVLCTNLNWTLVDGAFSSAVSVVSLLAVIGVLMKQMFFE